MTARLSVAHALTRALLVAMLICNAGFHAAARLMLTVLLKGLVSTSLQPWAHSDLDRLAKRWVVSVPPAGSGRDLHREVLLMCTAGISLSQGLSVLAAEAAKTAGQQACGAYLGAARNENLSQS